MLSASLPEDGSTVGFRNAEFCVKFRRWTESEIWDCVSDWYSIVKTLQCWTANVVQRCLVPRCPNMHNPPSAFRMSFPTHVTQTRMFAVTNYTYIISFWYLRLLEGYLMATIHNSIGLYVNQLTHKIKSMLLWTADLTSNVAWCVSTYVTPHNLPGFIWTIKSSTVQHRGSSHLQLCQADNPTQIRMPNWTYK
jgi:hypothetical protein